MMSHGSLNEPIGDTPQATDPRRGELLLRAICAGAVEVWPSIDRQGRRGIGMQLFPVGRFVGPTFLSIALDPSGVPEMSDALRDALLRVMAGR